MTSPAPLSEHALAVYDVLVATARRDAAGRMVSTEPVYRFLLDRFGIEDPASRRVRTRAIRELAEQGLARRLTVRGPGVEVLLSDVPPPDGAWTSHEDVSDDAGEALAYADYAAAIEGDLDAPRASVGRVEQAFLRRVLLSGREAAPCAFCGRDLPVDLLVAAHLKARSELTRQEKLRFREVAVLACTLGCDALYEHGYLAVDERGCLLTATADSSALRKHLAGMAGRTFGHPDQACASYLTKHRLQRFRRG